MLMIHKKFAVILAILIVMILPVKITLASTFSDVFGSSVEATAIYRLNELGILGGYPDGTFGPGKTVTRAEFSKITCVTAGLQSVASNMVGTASPFSDVAYDHWANSWINLASAKGYLKGDTSGTFRAEDKISQAEVITVLMRLLGYDDSLPGDWPSDYITKASDIGILDNIVFEASAPATRGEVAIMVSAILDQGNAQIVSNTNEPVFDSIQYSDGAQYKGYVINGVPNGQGTMIYPDGDKYVGEWQSGIICGQGTYTWSGGDKYTGNYVYGLRSGKGTYTWANGEKYEGEWKDNEKNGGGIIFEPDGSKFYGNWVNGKLNGGATYINSDGESFIAEYVDDELVSSRKITSNPVVTTPIIPTPVVTTPIIPTPVVTTPIISTPAVTGNSIKSKIDGDFEGWSGETIFKLFNGQIWQQDSYDYTYHYAYNPDVLIYQSGGSYMMHVDGVDKDIYVKQLTGVIETRIDGQFEGWDGDTIFNLQNGQIWQQSSLGLKLSLKLSPKVIIYPSGIGFKLHVDGVDKDIYVKRLK